jgi:hypothetical protein
MNTIIVINLVSSVLAAAGVGGFVARRNRRARKQVVQTLELPATRRR